MASGISHTSFNPKTSFLLTKSINSNLSRRSYTSRLIVATAQTESYWSSIEAEVGTYLKKAIPIRPPESVFEPMHHLSFSAPRTTAPALCVAACELVGGDRDRAMAAASALHLMHAAAHIHEHLPLTDRPSPGPTTIEHRYDPNIELLTGDGIIPFGLELLAGSMDPARNNQDEILRVIVEITRASGSQGVVDAQYQRLGLTHNDADDDRLMIEYVCRKKEGELHACGAACGAILGGGDEEEIAKLRKFGLYAGMVRGLSMVVSNRQWVEGKIEELKGLALKELESLNGKRRTELIASLVEPSLSAQLHV